MNVQISNEHNTLTEGLKKRFTGITPQQRGTFADPLQVNPFLMYLSEDGFSLLQIHSVTLRRRFCSSSPSSPHAREAEEDSDL